MINLWKKRQQNMALDNAEIAFVFVFSPFFDKDTNSF